MPTESYLYDADGQRVKKISGGVATYYPNPYYEVSGSTITKYYYFHGQRVAMRTNAGGGWAHYDLHSDHLGSTVFVTAQTGATHSMEGYYAYGRTRTGGIPVTDQKFTGQKRDGTGLQYFNARYYDPELGHFISPDTLVPDPGNLFDYNRYAYARLNPMKYTDPSGHNGVAVHDSNAGPPVAMSYGTMVSIQEDYYNLGVAWTDLPSDVRTAFEVQGTTGYMDFHGNATVQNGTIRDPAVIGASVYGIGRLVWQLPGLLMGACADGDCMNEADAATQLSQSVTRLTPDIGRKLDYMLGKATGSQHNVDRSTDMLQRLQSIGLPDTQATRNYLYNHFAQVLNDPTNVVKIQENGRMVRESFLMGPYGGLKLESVWEGSKLITMLLLNGGK